MKLTEITADKREQVIQWFIDNKVIDSLTVITPKFLNGKSEYAKEFRKYVEDMDEKTGVINFDDCEFKFKFKNKLNRPPPFKIGRVYMLEFHSLADIQMFDFSPTMCIGGLEVKLKDSKIDMNELAKALEKIKESDFISIRIEGTGWLKSITKLTEGVQRFMNMKSCNDIDIHLRGDQNKMFMRIEVTPDDAMIKLTEWGATDNKITAKRSFDNVMDLQEFLIDNKYEDLA